MLAALGLGACAAAPKGENPMPPDFSLSLTLSGSGTDDLEPAWFVLGPDWVLRAAIGDRSVTTPLPGAVRTVSRRQATRVWELASATNVLNEENPAGKAVSDDWVPKAGSGPVAVIYLSGDGLRRTRMLENPAPDSAAVALAHELRALAWVK